MNLDLHRDLRDQTCTLGYLSTPTRKWASIERPWVPIDESPSGRKGVSCVPPGVYKLEPHSSEAHRLVWALVNPSLWVYHYDHEVPVNRRGFARTVVLIHIANWASELRGCIALGKTRAREQGVWMVRQSSDAVNELRMAMAGQYDNSLTITERFS